jgi:hypothetical protein
VNVSVEGEVSSVVSGDVTVAGNRADGSIGVVDVNGLQPVVTPEPRHPIR